MKTGPILCKTLDVFRKLIIFHNVFRMFFVPIIKGMVKLYLFTDMIFHQLFVHLFEEFQRHLEMCCIIISYICYHFYVISFYLHFEQMVLTLTSLSLGWNKNIHLFSLKLTT